MVARIALLPLDGAHELRVAEAKGYCQLVDADDCWVAPALLEAADVLLAETGAFCCMTTRQVSHEAWNGDRLLPMDPRGRICSPRFLSFNLPRSVMGDVHGRIAAWTSQCRH